MAKTVGAKYELEMRAKDITKVKLRTTLKCMFCGKYDL